jgi:bifunctional oligoribonuclease and PAP phosphatase NrnA
MRLLGAALSNLHREGPLAWIWITREQMERSQAKEEDCEGLVNYALSIGNVEVAAFFREMPDGRYRVSLRSKGKLNVAEIAEGFGGGGHECASGFSMDGPLSIAVARLLEKVRPGFPVE